MTDDCPEYGVKGTSPIKWLRDEADACEWEDGRLAFWLREAADQLEDQVALLRKARPWVCWCRDMIRRTDDPEDVKLHADATLASIDAFLAADSSRGDDE